MEEAKTDALFESPLLYRIPNQPLKYVKEVAEFASKQTEIRNVLVVGGTFYAAHLKKLLGKDVNVDAVEIDPHEIQYQMVLSKMVEDGKTLDEALDIMCYPDDVIRNEYGTDYEYAFESSKLLKNLPVIREYWDETVETNTETGFLDFIARAVLNHKENKLKNGSFVDTARTGDEINRKYIGLMKDKRETPLRFGSIEELESWLKSGKFVSTARCGTYIKLNYYSPETLTEFEPDSGISTYAENVMDFKPERKYDLILSNNVYQLVGKAFSKEERFKGRSGYLEKEGVEKFFKKMMQMMNENAILEVSELSAGNCSLANAINLSDVQKETSVKNMNLEKKGDVKVSGTEREYNYCLFQKKRRLN